MRSSEKLCLYDLPNEVFLGGIDEVELWKD